MNKKQIILTAIMMFAVTNLSHAQLFFPALEKYSAAEKERLDRNYAASLMSANKGVVESALAIITMIKLDMPNEELPILRAKIENLATFSMVPAIRYKACLARAVFDNPAKFKQKGLQQL